MSTSLPEIVDPVSIEGSGVVLDGSDAGPGPGLVIRGGESTLRGMRIREFDGAGIVLVDGDDNRIVDTTVIDVTGPAVSVEGDSSGNSIGRTFPDDMGSGAAQESIGCHQPLDFDGDGEVDTGTDLVYLFRYLHGMEPVPAMFRLLEPRIPSDAVIAGKIEDLLATDDLADVDADGEVRGATDAVYLFRQLSGLAPVPARSRLLDPTVPSDELIGGRIGRIALESPQIVFVAGSGPDEATVRWLPARGGAGSPGSVRYEIHVSPIPDFEPSNATLFTVLQGTAQAKLNGLRPGAEQHIAIIAEDVAGNRSCEPGVRSVITPASPVVFSASTPFEDASRLGLGRPVEVTDDTLRFRPSEDAVAPQVDAILVGPDGDSGYLRRVEAVRHEGDELVVDTSPARLSDAVDQFSLSSTVVLFDVSEEIAGIEASSSGGPTGLVTTTEDSIAWRDGRLVAREVAPLENPRIVAGCSRDRDRERDENLTLALECGERIAISIDAIKFNKPALTSRIAWDPGGVQDGSELVLEMGLEANATVALKLPEGDSGDGIADFNIFERSFSVLWSVGPVPIWQQFTLALDFRGSVEPVGGEGVVVQSKVGFGGTAKLGIRYDAERQGWIPVGENGFTGETTPTLETKAGLDARFTLVPKLRVATWKVAKVELRLEPSIGAKIEAELTTIPECLLQLSKFDVGLRLECFAKISADFPFVEVPLLDDTKPEGKICGPVDFLFFTLPDVELGSSGVDPVQLVANPTMGGFNRIDVASAEWSASANAQLDVDPGDPLRASLRCGSGSEATVTFRSQGAFEGPLAPLTRRCEQIDVDCAQCTVGQRCDGECIDPQTNRANCGGCTSTGDGTECASGEECCGGACVDLESNPAHCRSCGNRCRSGERCVDRNCRCPGDQQFCQQAGRCVELGTRAHCRECGDACEAGEACVDGPAGKHCACQAPNVRCPDGTCADRQNDPNNCGICGRECEDESEICVGGECKCPDGWGRCGGSGPCYDIRRDPEHCGISCDDCTGAFGSGLCHDGNCLPLGTTSCPNGKCPPIESGPCMPSCGEGEKACCQGALLPDTPVCCREDLRCQGDPVDPDNPDQPICGFPCRNPSYEIHCQGACIDPRDDPSNCGGCTAEGKGEKCPEGSICVDGECQCDGCLIGEECCDGLCINPDNDNAYCGGCSEDGGGGDVCFEEVSGSGEEDTCCRGECADTDQDEANCGVCDLDCELLFDAEGVFPPERYEGSLLGMSCCAGECIDPFSDLDYCGGCTEDGLPVDTCVGAEDCCPDVDTGAPSCIDTTKHDEHCGACYDDGGTDCTQTDEKECCESGCRDIRFSESFCGGCITDPDSGELKGERCDLSERCCPASPSAKRGSCVTVLAGDPTELNDRFCGGCVEEGGEDCSKASGGRRNCCPRITGGFLCRNPDSDDRYCGASCQDCTFERRLCIRGSCVCDPTKPQCGEECCPTTGHVCSPDGASCACPSGRIECNDTCIVPNSNAHCGSCDPCPNQYQCRDRRCVYCNGEICGTLCCGENQGCVGGRCVCDPGYFTCDNGNCLNPIFVCNSRNDCGDNSDEVGCSNEATCCVKTQGCPGETGHVCAEHCCCCPKNEKCCADPAQGCCPD